MGVSDYLFMWIALLAIAAICDAAWVHAIRPILAPKRGWPDLEPDEMIPAWAWFGALVVIAVLFVVVPFVGMVAGF